MPDEALRRLRLGGHDPRKVYAAYKAAGRKLDMGKGCLRFKSLEELPLDVIAALVASTSVDARIEASEKAQTARKKK